MNGLAGNTVALTSTADYAEVARIESDEPGPWTIYSAASLVVASGAKKGYVVQLRITATTRSREGNGQRAFGWPAGGAVVVAGNEVVIEARVLLASGAAPSGGDTTTASVTVSIAPGNAVAGRPMNTKLSAVAQSGSVVSGASGRTKSLYGLSAAAAATFVLFFDLDGGAAGSAPTIATGETAIIFACGLDAGQWFALDTPLPFAHGLCWATSTSSSSYQPDAAQVRLLAEWE